MGFNLIKNKITISQNDEIMIQYDLLKRNLLKKYNEENDEFFNELHIKFQELLNELKLSPTTKKNWSSI